MTAADPARVARIARLLPRLASDAPGEVLATVAALRRQLAAAGADLHDLARMIEAGAQSDAAAPEEPDDDDRWTDDLATLAAHFERLDPHEQDFARNLTRLARRGLAPSERQRRWLAVIAERIVETEGAECP